MATLTQTTSSGTLQVVTFHVGNLLLGLEIDQIREINRQLDTTVVPQAPAFVRGVINLRGEVVTVVDVRALLGIKRAEPTPHSRNVVIYSDGELIGLVVDRIGDVLTIDTAEINPPPTNVNGVENECFRGVHVKDNAIVVLLDVGMLLNETQHA